MAIHRIDVGLPRLQLDAAELTAEEREYLAGVDRWRAAEGAYALPQRAKPQTLAYALNDSPVGLAAWIGEKFRAWSDCDGDVERRFTEDEPPTNIAIHWLTETIGSSFRLYHDAAQIPLEQRARRIEVPCGVALSRATSPSRRGRGPSARRTWSAGPRCRAAGTSRRSREPELHAQDLRAFFLRYRDR